MKISIYKDGVSTVVEFPKPTLELQDILDRQHNQQDNACVNFQDLNEVARQLHDLSPENIVKVKAIMEETDEHDIADLRRVLRTMDEYQFDVVDDDSHYALRYLRENLPDGFDISALANTDLYALGVTILGTKQGSMTEYGVLVHDCDLYSMLPKPEWMQEESQSEDETEDCELKWGDIS